MSFSDQGQSNNLLMNNPDSFAMAFDEIWKNYISNLNQKNLNQDEKIQLVFKKIVDHPFLINFPAQALEVAKFRIRLLNLDQ